MNKESSKIKSTFDVKAFYKGIIEILRKYSLNLILMMGLFGVLLSLYFSEAMDLPPCDLCWYQRVLFYPIPIVALVALLMRDKKAHYYILALSAIGLPISIYHHLLKVTDIFPKETPFCKTDGACGDLEWELWTGSGITIPLLCALGFAGTLFLCIIRLVKVRNI
ncbi:disulfide bond formation protein B [Candidatus Dojkabacteria bacterium]|nr:disulfide bond formation protein B [Candidatus Dojkabacteria bacterium]